MNAEAAVPFFQVTAYNWKLIIYTALILSIKFQTEYNLTTKIIYKQHKIFDKESMNKWMN